MGKPTKTENTYRNTGDKLFEELGITSVEGKDPNTMPSFEDNRQGFGSDFSNIDLSKYKGTVNKPSLPFRNDGENKAYLDKTYRAIKANNQGSIGQIFNAVVGGVGGGALGALENISMIPQSFSDDFEKNAVAQVFADLRKGVQDATPIYAKDDAKGLSEINELADVWQGAKSVIDSAVSFGGSGGFIGKAVSYGGKLARLSRLSKLGKVLNANKITNSVYQKTNALLSRAANSKTFQQAAEAGVAGVLSNQLEGTVMAVEMYDSIHKELLSKGIDDKKAREIAQERANEMEEMNRSLLLSNVFQMYGLSKVLGGTRNVATAPGIMNAVKESLSFSKGKLSNNIIMQNLNEGFEEMIQSATQQSLEKLAQVDAGLIESNKNKYELIFDNFLSDQALLEGAMGFFGGAMQRGVSAASYEMFTSKEEKNEYKKRYEKQQENIKKNAELVKANVSKYAQAELLRQKAVKEGDADFEKLIGDVQFLEIATNSFDLGTTGQLEAILDDMSKNPETAEQAKVMSKKLVELEDKWIKTADTSVANTRQTFLAQVEKDIYYEQLDGLQKKKTEAVNGLRTAIHNIASTKTVSAKSLSFSNLIGGKLSDYITVNKDGKVEYSKQLDNNPETVKAVQELNQEIEELSKPLAKLEGNLNMLTEQISKNSITLEVLQSKELQEELLKAKEAEEKAQTITQEITKENVEEKEAELKEIETELEPKQLKKIQEQVETVKEEKNEEFEQAIEDKYAELEEEAAPVDDSVEFDEATDIFGEAKAKEDDYLATADKIQKEIENDTRVVEDLADKVKEDKLEESEASNLANNITEVEKKIREDSYSENTPITLITDVSDSFEKEETTKEETKSNITTKEITKEDLIEERKTLQEEKKEILEEIKEVEKELKKELTEAENKKSNLKDEIKKEEAVERKLKDKKRAILKKVNSEIDQVTSVDTLIEEEVTDKEVTNIAKEENIEESQVKKEIKKKVVALMNDKSNLKPRTLLEKVASRIKKTLLNMMIAVTLMSNISFTYAPKASALTYDNAKIENLKSFDNVKMSQDEVNKKDNIDIITKYQSEKKGKYLVVDKAAQLAHLYEEGNLITTFEVGTGKKTGDKQTKTVVKNGKVMWNEGNMQTGAGIYTVSGKGTYSNSPSFTMKNERGVEIPTVLHKTLSDRKKIFKDNNLANNRMSYGCVNFQAKDINALGSYGDFDKGSKIYILPDNPNNKFKIVDGELRFTANDKDVNKTISSYKATPITIKSSRRLNNNAKSFVQTLADSKDTLMQLYPTISNDIYNRIAKVAYGIIGQESSFGSYGGARGQYGRARDNAQLVLNELGAELDPSVGLGQIRLSTVPDTARKVFDINTPYDLTNPDKNAQGVMASLLDSYVNQIKNSQKENLESILPVIHSHQRELVKKANKGIDISSNSYVKSVASKSSELTVYLGEAKSDNKKSLQDTSGAEFLLLGLPLVSIRKKRKDGEITNEEALVELRKRLAYVEKRIIDLNKQLNTEEKPTPTKPTSEVKEVEQKEEGTARVHEAHDKVAYLASSYKKTKEGKKEDVLNEKGEINLNSTYLYTVNPNNLLEGTELTLRVSTNPDQVIFVDGKKVKYQDWRNANPTADLTDLAPIEIVAGDTVIGYLHTPSWINERRVTGKRMSIEKQQEKLRETRKAVIENGEVKTKVNYRSYGKLLKKESASVAENLPGVDLVIYRDGVFTNKADRTPIQDINIIGEDFEEGRSYTLIHMKGNEYLPTPVIHNKLNEEISTSIVKAIEAYVSQENSDIVQEITKTMKMDILTAGGLNDYINTFFATKSLRGFDIGLKNLQKDTHRFLNNIDYNNNVIGRPFIIVEKGNVIFGREGMKSESFKYVTKGSNSTADLDAFKEHLSAGYVNHALRDNPPVLISADNKPIIKESYDSFIKEQVNTNLYGIEVAEGVKAYTTQPIIKFGEIEKKAKVETLGDIEDDLMGFMNDNPELLDYSPVEAVEDTLNDLDNGC